MIPSIFNGWNDYDDSGDDDPRDVGGPEACPVCAAGGGVPCADCLEDGYDWCDNCGLLDNLNKHACMEGK